ncbi:MAG: sugar phosphate nucleotidyltransferase [bacterium]
MADIRAIIPAAGIGKRMRPLTLARPKVLLPLAGRPIIGHIIADLVRIGIQDITVVIGYFGESVIEYCREAFPKVNFRFVEQEQRLGLGHAIGRAIHEDDRQTLIILGDTLYRGDIGAFMGDTAALGLVQVNDPRRLGIAKVENGVITYLEEKPEKPASNLALAGVYYVPDAQVLLAAIRHIVQNDIKTHGEFQITDALHKMIKDGEVFRAIELEGWYDCGVPSTLIETNRILLDSKPELRNVAAKFKKNNIIIEPVSIDDKAEIENCIIGPYVHVGANTKLNRSIIRNSIIDEESVLEGVHLDGAALGRQVEMRRGGEAFLLGDYASMDRS